MLRFSQILSPDAPPVFEKSRLDSQLEIVCQTAVSRFFRGPYKDGVEQPLRTVACGKFFDPWVCEWSTGSCHSGFPPEE
jgi:hypothetical protein